MNCIGPTTPEDFELLAYADGEGTPEVAAHISTCVSCRSRSGELIREQRAWQRALLRAACPAALELGEHAVRMLPVERAEQVAEHVSACPVCAGEVAALAEFLSRVEDSRLEEGLAEAGAVLRTIHARLARFGAEGGTAGGAPMPRAVRELRGPYLGDATPLTYDAEHLLVTVEFWPESGAATRRLVGLVAGDDDFTGAEVEVTGEDGSTRSAPVDELGSFSLRGLPTGAHRLRVRLPAKGVQVLIDPLNVA